MSVIVTDNLPPEAFFRVAQHHYFKDKEFLAQLGTRDEVRQILLDAIEANVDICFRFINHELAEWTMKKMEYHSTNLFSKYIAVSHDVLIVVTPLRPIGFTKMHEVLDLMLKNGEIKFQVLYTEQDY